MNRLNRWALGTVWMLTMLLLPGLAAATTYYVDDGGSDGNNGLSASTPWKTISHAAGSISGGTADNPDILVVAAGTYDIGNGETFPITFTGNYINLAGNSAASVFIDTLKPGPAISIALQINGKGVHVSGFTFQHATDAIAFTQGGFSVTDCVFANSVYRGLTFIRSDPALSSSISHGDMSISGNTFQASGNSVEIQLQEVFDNSTEHLTAAIGNLSVTGNTFAGSTRGIYIPVITISKLLNGTATVGDVTVSNNSFTGGDSGVYIGTSVFGDFKDTRFTAGNMNISNNTFTGQQSYGLYVDSRSFSNVSGSSAVNLGSLTVQGNTITSDPSTNPGCRGIDLRRDQFSTITDSSTVDVASVTVNNNTVSVDGTSLFLAGNIVNGIGQMFMYDTVAVTTGSTTVSGNRLTSVSDTGIDIVYSSFGASVFGQSRISRGPLSIGHNTVQSDGSACMVNENSSGSGMYEESSLLTNGMNVDSNTFTSMNGSALLIVSSGKGNALQDEASVTARALSISGNTLKSPATGIYLLESSFAIALQNKASFTGGALVIDRNSIQPVATSAGISNGIFVTLAAMGVSNLGQTSSTFGNITISNNQISDVNSMGVLFQASSIGGGGIGMNRVAFGDMDISNNTMERISLGTYAMLAGLSTASNGSVTVGRLTINGNSMTDVGNIGVLANYQAQNNDPDTATLAIGAPQIDDNSISGTATGSNGIHFTVNLTSTGVSLGTPVLSGNSVTGFQYGINLLNDGKGAELKCNTLENNVMSGLYLDSDESFIATYNAFVGNGKGLQINGPRTATVKAERNWWGDAAGPAACTSCNKIDTGGGTVDYTPWLTSIYQMRCSDFPWPMFIPAFTGHGRR